MSFSTLKILATVKRWWKNYSGKLGFSTLKILATVKHVLQQYSYEKVLVPLRF